MSTPDEQAAPQLRLFDARTSVRAHPEWFFRSGSFSIEELLGLVTHEATTHGCTDFTSRRLGDWWLLESSHDWLEGDLAAFLSLRPDPLGGPNASRVEILMTAFCTSVWTAGPGDPYDVTTTRPLPDALFEALRDCRGRAIALLPPAPATRLAPEHAPGRHLQLVPDGDLTARYDEVLTRLAEKDQAFPEGDSP